MKFMNPLLAVTDMEKSVAFYKEVLGLNKIMDFGANVTLTGGVCLQTHETWTFTMSTQSKNTDGASVWYAFMTRTTILSRWVKT